MHGFLERKGTENMTDGLLLLSLLGIAVLMWVVIAQRGLGEKPRELGVKEKQLTSCVENSHCVSSMDGKGLSPLPYKKSKEEAKSDLLSIVQRMKRTRVVKHDPQYIHVECMSPITRTIDDVEFLIDDEAKVIHFRSASRLRIGRDKNRERMETIRRKFEDRQ